MDPVDGSYTGSNFTANATVVGFCDPVRNASVPCCAVDGCSSCSRYVLCDACADGWKLVRGQCVAVMPSNSSAVICNNP